MTTDTCRHCDQEIAHDGAEWVHTADDYALCDEPHQTAAEPKNERDRRTRP